MAKGVDAAMRAICEAVGKRESMDAATVRVELVGRLAAVTRAVQKTSGEAAQWYHSASCCSSSGLWLCSFSSMMLVFAFRTLVVSMCSCVESPSERPLMSPSSLIYPGGRFFFASLPYVLVHLRCLFLACLKGKFGCFRLVPSAVHLTVSHFRVCPQ